MAIHINTLNGGDITITTGSVLDDTKTRFTLQDGTVESYDITGTLDQQWMVDNGFFDDNVCQWWKTITEVDIGNTVTSIGQEAFAWCYDLTSVTIPNSVTSIVSVPFYRCRGLTSVTFNNFTKNEVKDLTTGEESKIFGDGFVDAEDNIMEKSFTAICTDGSMTIHFSADDPATITFTDL